MEGKERVAESERFIGKIRDPRLEEGLGERIEKDQEWQKQFSQEILRPISVIMLERVHIKEGRDNKMRPR